MRLTAFICQQSKFSGFRLVAAYLLILFFSMESNRLLAEGTLQLEPPNAPIRSYCRVALSNNSTDHRIPFALIGCASEYRLNIRIKDYTKEKIYIGFGQITNYYEDTSVLQDVSFRMLNPDLSIVPGFALQQVPYQAGEDGFINSRAEANAGPKINSTNPNGYQPLVITPAQNGDFIIEFEIPQMGQTDARVFKYLDITVASVITPIQGRLWSKAWQLSSANVDAEQNSSYSSFYIYSDDGIVTRFNCNGLAGGIWSIYSNEFGCNTTGNWTERRRSVNGNASVSPQYKIFLNDPDIVLFPSGVPGVMYSFEKYTSDCDTLLTFITEVSKKGNIEILLDLPPSNPGTTGVEDVQLGYAVNAGFNILTPGWNGMSSIGKPIPNGIVIEARIRYLNGLSNLPLFDVEDNPEGFMVDIQRPMPASGNSRLKVYWDDSLLPPEMGPTINTLVGCTYTGISPLSGCHEWNIDSNLGDKNTMNSWWYYSTDETISIPVTLWLGPASGKISGPSDLCFGQSAIYRTRSIPHADKYSWILSGPGFSQTIEKLAPDTTLTLQFSQAMQPGMYTIRLRGIGSTCGNGPETGFSFYVYGNQPPPIHGNLQVCSAAQHQFSVDGNYISVEWRTSSGTIIGSPAMNPVSIYWTQAGNDTVKVITNSVDCGIRESSLAVNVLPSAVVEFSMPDQNIVCQGVAAQFKDLSTISQASIISRTWDWGDGNIENTNAIEIVHRYALPGYYSITLKETTQQGCTTSKSGTILVKSPPVADFSLYRNCISDSLELKDLSSGEDISAWIWDYNNLPVTAFDEEQSVSGAIYNSIGNYPVTLIVYNRFGCADTLTREIQIHENPVADFTFENPCQQTDILFTDQSLPADTGLILYSWDVNTGARSRASWYGNPVHLNFEEARAYEVTHEVTDGFGCRSINKKTIHVNPKPRSNFLFTEDVNGVNGLLEFLNRSEGADFYYWNFGNGETSELPEPQIKYNQDGRFNISLVVINSEGCSDTSEVSYFYTPGVWLPNVFSPDFNGKNDQFRPVTQNKSLNPFQMLIFDKWGQLLFESNNPDIGWDGTNKGNMCNTGEYVYVLRYSEQKDEGDHQVVKKGMILLLR